MRRGSNLSKRQAGLLVIFVAACVGAALFLAQTEAASPPDSGASRADASDGDGPGAAPETIQAPRGAASRSGPPEADRAPAAQDSPVQETRASTGQLEVFALGPSGSVAGASLSVTRVGPLDDVLWRSRGSKQVEPAGVLHPLKPADLGQRVAARTDPDGRWLSEIEPGRYWIKLSRPGGSTVTILDGSRSLDGVVAAVLPSTLTTVELSTVSSAEIVVRLSRVDASEGARGETRIDPQLGASDVQLSCQVGTTTWTRTNGSQEGDLITFGDLEPGTYEVVPTPVGRWTFAPISVDVQAGERRLVDVQLDPIRAALLTLRARDTAGRAVPLCVHYTLEAVSDSQGSDPPPAVVIASVSGFSAPDGRVELDVPPGTYRFEHRLTRIASYQSHGLAPRDVLGEPRTIVVHEDRTVTPPTIDVTVALKGALCELAGEFTGQESARRGPYALEYALSDGTVERLSIRPTDWPRFRALIDLGRLGDPSARLIDENRIEDGPLADVSLIAPRTEWRVDLRR